VRLQRALQAAEASHYRSLEALKSLERAASAASVAYQAAHLGGSEENDDDDENDDEGLDGDGKLGQRAGLFGSGAAVAGARGLRDLRLRKTTAAKAKKKTRAGLPRGGLGGSVVDPALAAALASARREASEAAAWADVCRGERDAGQRRVRQASLSVAAGVQVRLCLPLSQAVRKCPLWQRCPVCAEAPTLLQMQPLDGKVSLTLPF